MKKKNETRTILFLSVLKVLSATMHRYRDLRQNVIRNSSRPYSCIVSGTTTEDRRRRLTRIYIQKYFEKSLRESKSIHKQVYVGTQLLSRFRRNFL